MTHDSISNNDIRITVSAPSHSRDHNIRQQCAAQSYVIWPRQPGERGRAIATLVPRIAEGEMQDDDRRGEYFAAVYWYTRRGDPASRCLLFRTRLPRKCASEALMHLCDVLSWPELREIGGVAGLRDDSAEQDLGDSRHAGAENDDTNTRPVGDEHHVDASVSSSIGSIYEMHVSSLEEAEAKLHGIPYLVPSDQDQDLRPVSDYEVHLFGGPLSRRAIHQSKDFTLATHNDVRIITPSPADEPEPPNDRPCPLFWLNDGKAQIYTRYLDGRTRTKLGSAYTISDISPLNSPVGGAAATKRRLRLTRVRSGRSYEQRTLATVGREPIDRPRYGHHRVSSMTTGSDGSEQSFGTASAGEGPQPVEVVDVDVDADEGLETDYTVIEQVYHQMVGTNKMTGVQAQAQARVQTDAWPKPKSTRELYYENADRLRGG